MSATKGVTIGRKLEDSGAGLRVMDSVTTQGAGVLSSALGEGTVSVFSVPAETVLLTASICAWNIWRGGFWEP